MAKVKTVEVTITRDTTHAVVKTVPVYEVEALRALYGDAVRVGEAGEPVEVESAAEEYARLDRVYRAKTDDNGQPVSVVRDAFGSQAEFERQFEAATIKARRKAD